MDYIRSFFVSSGLTAGFNSPAGIIDVSVVPVRNLAKYMYLRLFSREDTNSKDDNENRDYGSENPSKITGLCPRKPRDLCR